MSPRYTHQTSVLLRNAPSLLGPQGWSLEQLHGTLDFLDYMPLQRQAEQGPPDDLPRAHGLYRAQVNREGALLWDTLSLEAPSALAERAADGAYLEYGLQESEGHWTRIHGTYTPALHQQLLRQGLDRPPPRPGAWPETARLVPLLHVRCGEEEQVVLAQDHTVDADQFDKEYALWRALDTILTEHNYTQAEALTRAEGYLEDALAAQQEGDQGGMIRAGMLHEAWTTGAEALADGFIPTEQVRAGFIETGQVYRASGPGRPQDFLRCQAVLELPIGGGRPVIRELRGRFDPERLGDLHTQLGALTPDELQRLHALALGGTLMVPVTEETGDDGRTWTELDLDRARAVQLCVLCDEETTDRSLEGDTTVACCARHHPEWPT